MMDTMIRPLANDDSVHHQESASINKMVKGGSSWATVKVILGWIISTLQNTIYFPARRIAHILEILASIGATQRCVSLKKRQQVLGELQSVALAIPADIGIFSVLQESLKTSD
jgi:hypothetical protein